MIRQDAATARCHTWDEAYEMLSFTIDTLSVQPAVFSGCGVRACITTSTAAPAAVGRGLRHSWHRLPTGLLRQVRPNLLAGCKTVPP
jgi:hypothetical protein